MRRHSAAPLGSLGCDLPQARCRRRANRNLNRSSFKSCKMPSTKKPVPRSKKWAPKTKTGCTVCRARRIKCDETWPICKRCIISKKQCGYVMAERELIAGMPKVGPPQSLTVRIHPPDLSATSEDVSLFHYFRLEMASNFSGAFNHTYWSDHMLHALQHQPAIWQACVALAAMDRAQKDGRLDGQTPNRQNSKLFLLSAESYQAALRTLRPLTLMNTELSIENKLAVLATNLVFATHAGLRGELTECGNLVKEGIKMIAHWKLWKLAKKPSDPRTETMNPAESLMLTYLRLDSNAVEIMEHHVPEKDAISIPPGTIDLPFHSTWQAYLEFEVLWHSTVKLINNHLLVESVDIEQVLDTQRKLQQVATRWSRKLGDFETSRSFKPEHAIKTRILRIRHTLIEILLAMEPNPREIRWDSFKSKFAHIIDVAETLSKHLDETIGWPCLTNPIGLSVVVTLSVVAWRCRYAKLRHKALHLALHESNRRFPGQEPSITQPSMAIIQVEESTWINDNQPGTCECVVGSWVCEDHRIAERTGIWRSDERYVMSYRTNEDLRLGRPTRTAMV